ncbi:MAG: hypothetical protein AAF611_01775 [Bacteroidota bacterium]
MKNQFEKTANSLPNAFYDLIAYVIPSGIFIFFLIFEKVVNINSYDSNLSFFKDSWIYDLFFSFLYIALLYTLGVIISTLSYVLVRKPVLFFLSKFKKINSKMKKGLGTQMLTVQVQFNTEIYSEMLKKYARVILLRNLTLTFLAILIIKMVYLWNYDYLLMYLFLFGIVFAAYCIRHYWFLQNLSQLHKSNT